MIGRAILESADTVFYFKDGMTHYIKDRNRDGYQYTEEEKILIKLGAVCVG